VPSRPDVGREVGVLERRAKRRVAEPFPTTVSGIDKAVQSFELDCVLDNIRYGPVAANSSANAYRRGSETYCPPFEWLDERSERQDLRRDPP
jgi:hypothetical protein